MLEAVSRHGLELAVAELLVRRRAHVLAGQARARHALIVGGEGHRHTGLDVLAERVLGAGHFEDLYVAAEAHLDQHVARAHVGEERGGIGLAQHVDAVADALGVAGIDGAAHVVGVGVGVGRRQELRRELTGVERDVERALLGHRVLGVQEVEHRHVQVVVPQRGGVVFRRREVHRHDLPGLGRHFVGAHQLAEDGVVGARARDLGHEAHAHLAAGRRARAVAPEDVLVGGARGIHRGHVGIDLGVEAGVGGEGVVKAGQGVGGDAAGEHRRGEGAHVLAEVEHGLDVELVLVGRAVQHVGDAVVAVGAGDGAVLSEGGEEVIVAGLGAGHEVLHAPGPENLLEEWAGGRRRLRGGGALVAVHRGEGGAVDAVAVGLAPVEVGLRVHRAAQVVVEIAALGHRLGEGREVGGGAHHRVEALRSALLPGARALGGGSGAGGARICGGLGVGCSAIGARQRLRGAAAGRASPAGSSRETNQATKDRYTGHRHTRWASWALDYSAAIVHLFHETGADATRATPMAHRVARTWHRWGAGGTSPKLRRSGGARLRSRRRRWRHPRGSRGARRR